MTTSARPTSFSFTATTPVPGSLQVPLTSFPVGDYRLEIKITDKAANKTLTHDIKFTVKG